MSDEEVVAYSHVLRARIVGEVSSLAGQLAWAAAWLFVERLLDAAEELLSESGFVRRGLKQSYVESLGRRGRRQRRRPVGPNA